MRWATLPNHHSASNGKNRRGPTGSHRDHACGYGLEQVAKEFRDLALPEGWHNIPAVRDSRVFLVEASGYFSRPGPRLAAGMAILADAIHAGNGRDLHHPAQV